jgi:hypothetical protein
LKTGQTVHFKVDAETKTIQMSVQKAAKRDVDRAYGFMKKHRLEKQGLNTTAEWMKLLRGEG